MNPTISQKKYHIAVNRLADLIAALVIAASAAVIIYSVMKAGVSIKDVIKFVILAVFYVTLPGYLIARKVAAIKDSSCMISFCMIFSAVFLILFYFADELIVKRYFMGISGIFSSLPGFLGAGIAENVAGGVLLEVYGCPVLSLISIILLISDIKKKKVSVTSFVPDIRVTAIIAVAMLITFFSLYMRISVPVTKMGSTSIYYDVAWLISNDASVAKGWPADSLQYLGKQLNSNILANIYRASLSRVSAFSSAEMFGISAAFFAIPNCIFAVDALGKRFLKKRNKAFFSTFTFVFASFFSVAIIHFVNLDKAVSVAKSSYYYSAMVNIFCCPNGIDLAIPALCVFVILIQDFVESEHLRSSCLIAVFGAAALCTGAKFVFTICVLAAIAAAGILRLIQGNGFKEFARYLIVGFVSILAFVIPYFLVVKGGRVYMDPTQAEPEYSWEAQYNDYEDEEYEYANQYSSINLGLGVKDTKLFKDVKSVFRLSDEWDNLLCKLLIPVHFLLQELFVALPFIIWVVSRLRRFKQIRAMEMLLGGIALCGIIIYYFLNVDGHSQVYFYFCASVMINIIGAGWIYDHFRSLKAVWKVIAVIAFLVSLASTITIASDRFMPGIENLRIISDKYRHNESVSTYDAITDSEYEAMLWLKNHTEKDAVIAIDRHYQQKVSEGTIPEPNQAASKYYYYTAYSERQTFIGSWAYMPRTAEMQQQIVERLRTNDALFSQDCLNRREIMEENGISYIVVSTFVTPAPILADECLEVVFVNRDIIIYKLV